MKIAITAKEPSLDSDVEERFGRSPYFLIVDVETMEFESIENPNISASGGAGIQSAKLMFDKGVKAILTGNCGPNAFNVFNASGIDVIIGVNGKVRAAAENFKKGQFSQALSPNVESHSGMGQSGPQPTQTASPAGAFPGMGFGRGRGRGGGMGRGRGLGRQMGQNPESYQSEMLSDESVNPEDEISMLKKEIEALDEYRKEILKRIEDLKTGKP